MKTYAVSIIILTYGKAHLTRQCLESLDTTVDRERTEIILFDNGSRGDELHQLRALAKNHGARLHENGENVGFAAGCNEAARLATGEILVFLNNDIIALPGWLEALSPASRDVADTVNGSLLLYPDGTVQHAGIGFGYWGLPFNLGVGESEAKFGHSGGHRYTLGTTGACLGVSARLFHELGGFDRRYFFSYEDVDLCLRARLRGKRTVIRTESRLIHAESSTAAGDLRISPLRARAEELFVERWKGLFDRILRRAYASLQSRGLSRILIFGAGAAGRRMRANIERLSQMRVLGFVDSAAGSSAFAVQDVYAPHEAPDADAVIGASMYLASLQKVADAAPWRDRFIAGAISDLDDVDLSGAELNLQTDG